MVRDVKHTRLPVIVLRVDAEYLREVLDMNAAAITQTIKALDGEHLPFHRRQVLRQPAESIHIDQL